MNKLLSNILDNLATRLGYVRASEIAPVVFGVEPVAETAFLELSNGKVIFPIATDKRGKPIQFERGTAYIVGTNGRWRKRRNVSATAVEAETRADDADESETANAPRSGWTQNRKSHNEPAQPRTRFDGSKSDASLYQHWHRLRASSADASNPGVNMVEPWKQFDNFARDVHEDGTFGRGMTLVRKDASKPFGPGNFQFVRRSSLEAGRVPHRKLTDIEVKHIRNSPQTLRSLSALYGMSVSSVRDIRTGHSYRDIH